MLRSLKEGYQQGVLWENSKVCQMVNRNTRCKHTSQTKELLLKFPTRCYNFRYVNHKNVHTGNSQILWLTKHLYLRSDSKTLHPTQCKPARRHMVSRLMSLQNRGKWSRGRRERDWMEHGWMDKKEEEGIWPCDRLSQGGLEGWGWQGKKRMHACLRENRGESRQSEMKTIL